MRTCAGEEGRKQGGQWELCREQSGKGWVHLSDSSASRHGVYDGRRQRRGANTALHSLTKKSLGGIPLRNLARLRHASDINNKRVRSHRDNKIPGGIEWDPSGIVGSHPGSCSAASAFLKQKDIIALSPVVDNS